jgi:hypothetical protein
MRQSPRKPRSYAARVVHAIAGMGTARGTRRARVAVTAGRMAAVTRLAKSEVK